MLIIDIQDNFFLNLFKLSNKHKIIQIAQYKHNNIAGESSLWKITFANQNTKIAKLTGDSYRSRWWLALTFQLLDHSKSYSIVISRFSYPLKIYQKLSSHLWCYV